MPLRLIHHMSAIGARLEDALRGRELPSPHSELTVRFGLREPFSTSPRLNALRRFTFGLIA